MAFVFFREKILNYQVPLYILTVWWKSNLKRFEGDAQIIEYPHRVTANEFDVFPAQNLNYVPYGSDKW